MSLPVLERDAGRCPWPEKIAHVSEVLAGRAVNHRRRQGEHVRAYRCPCGAWHTGRPPKTEALSLVRVPQGTARGDVVWTRTYCEWCWTPLVVAHKHDDELTQAAFCNSVHAQKHRYWVTRRERQRKVYAERLCATCGEPFMADMSSNIDFPQQYCCETCARRAKRARQTQRKLAVSGRLLIEQSWLPRQDPTALVKVLSHIRACQRAPWPELDIRLDDALPDGRVEVDAEDMPATVRIGTGPVTGLDWAARDAVWIVWDGYAGQPGLREIARAAHVPEHPRLVLHHEWILKQFDWYERTP